VPGPNFVWHIDGYMKLEPFGIEVRFPSRWASRWALIGTNSHR
jgi:hypothetical protein